MASSSRPSTRDNFVHAGPSCGVAFAELAKENIHFHHKALTVTGIGYFCKPCNVNVATAYDCFGPVHARGALKRAAVASTMKGVCIFMPVRDESESDSDSESESESEDESSDEVMPAKRARGTPKSHA